MQVWLAVFLPLIVQLDVWKPCRGQGVHYVITMAALFAIFATTLLLMSGIFLFGTRGDLLHLSQTYCLATYHQSAIGTHSLYLAGACFELSKRQGAVVLLYFQSFVWGAQAVFMGTHLPNGIDVVAFIINSFSKIQIRRTIHGFQCGYNDQSNKEAIFKLITCTAVPPLGAALIFRQIVFLYLLIICAVQCTERSSCTQWSPHAGTSRARTGHCAT